MSFRGLFIGIDRYQSLDINELSCARRDALALEALFADTLGGTSALLIDSAATRARIEEEFQALSTCAPDDTVVIAFSGHGSGDHHLVTYDTDVANLPNTAISLDLIQEWFSRIPARRLVFFLDCCFSGGLGAKVLQLDIKARDLRSTEARLAQLAGDGRIIFTASRADEPAYEDVRVGHGFLTHFLLEGLRGTDEVMAEGRLSLYRLLDYVTARVKAAALQLGRAQNPTMRGRVDGDLAWPVFVIGERYLLAFPERRPVRVDSSLASLVDAGFPEQLIEAWSKAIPSLNALQITALNDYGLLAGEHLVVSAPTSSGKTMVGELAALRSVLNRQRALFLLPLKALVADKRRHFEAVYGPFGIRTVEATGETDDITPLLRGRYDIGLLTYEKFAAIALTFPHVLAQVGAIVVDEAQMIADEGRGANLEFILTLLRMRRREGIAPQIIALSAVIGATNGLEEWLGGRLLRRTERPVPLDEGLLLGNGQFRYLDSATGAETLSKPIVQRVFRKDTSQDWIIPLVRKLVSEGQQVIVFRETKGSARGCAKYLAEALGLPAAQEAIRRLPVPDPSQAHQELRETLAGGVAFHHSDLMPEERRVVEEEFRQPNAGLRVIAATTTLAMGVNTPASAVIIAGLQHPGEQPYSVAEYKNLVGRAGRLGYSEKGTSYLLALDHRAEHELWGRYVTGTPEDLHSRFLDPSTDARSLIVRVLASAHRTAREGVTREQIIDFLEASFGAFLASRSQAGWKWSRDDIGLALDDLEQHGLVGLKGDRYELTALGRLAGESGTEIRSILRLVDCIRPLKPETITDPVLLMAVQTTIELDDVLFPINRKSTEKEPQLWPSELRRQGIPPAILAALHRNVVDEHQPTLRAKKAVACLLFVSGRAMADMERVLTQFGGAFAGAAGPIRSVASRTCDFLPVAARVAEILHPTLDLGDRVGRLIIRLTYGIPADAVDLAREAGAELLRGEYCGLAQARFCEPAAIATADDAVLLRLLNGDRQKLTLLRQAAIRVQQRRDRASMVTEPVLDAYVA